MPAPPAAGTLYFLSFASAPGGANRPASASFDEQGRLARLQGTGFEIPVPAFVEIGDRIEIDPHNNEFRKRV